MTKNQWRDVGKNMRKALSKSDRTFQSETICKKIIADPRWQRAHTVLLFLSFGDEWDTFSLIKEAWATGKTVALPVCQPKNQMIPCIYEKNTPLLTTKGHLKEIAPEAIKPIPISTIDFCLVPGLLFDPYGTRIGYGAGYYDRFLEKLPSACDILAAGFDVQLIGDALPHENTDVLLPEIITSATHILTIPNN